MKRFRLLLWLGPLLLFIVACGGGVADEPAAEVSDLSPRPVETEVATAVPTEPAAVEPESPTAVPTATLLPTAEPDPTATAEEIVAEAEEDDAAAAASAAESAAVAVAFNGRTEEGALFRGAADAPVTLIDYSDFL